MGLDMRFFNLKTSLKFSLSFFFFEAFLLNPLTATNKPPRLTVVIVIDQFAYDYVDKLKPFLDGGIKKLVDKGIFFTNAHYPHGIPSTSTGHAGLATGAYAERHGICSNRWVHHDGQVLECTQDPSGKAKVFGRKDGWSESPESLKADTLEDQFVMSSEPKRNLQAYSISLKSRASILMAGKMGKAIWFDMKNGWLTSSTSYFSELPEWLKKFNSENCPKPKDTFSWKSFYKLGGEEYNFNQAKNYKYIAHKGSMVGHSKIPMGRSQDDPFFFYIKSPNSNQLLLDAATTCLKTNLSKNKKEDGFLLMISLSSLDFAGHIYGPSAAETIDILYHLDKQIENFMDSTKKLVPESETLFVLTADHGMMPIPEVLNDKGFSHAKRIDVKPIIEKFNYGVEREYGIKNMVATYVTPQFFFNKKKLRSLPEVEQENIIDQFKEHLLSINGIREVFTNKELEEKTFHNNREAKLLQHQCYRGRTPELTCLLHPYYLMTGYDTGGSHATPYNYDTHVPLSIFQKGKFEDSVIKKQVSMLSLPQTLAQILNVPPPSCSCKKILPGIFT